MARALRANGTSRRKTTWPDPEKGSVGDRRRANDISESRGTGSRGATPVTGELVSTTTEMVCRGNISAIEAEHIQSPAQLLQGRIETISPRQIEGWAWDPEVPDKRIRLELVEGSNRLSETVADRYRQDLVELGAATADMGSVLSCKKACYLKVTQL
jgi:hypothetical protein